MTDPTPRRPLHRRAVVFGLLLAATLAFGAAARRASLPDPTPPRITNGNGAVAVTAGLDRGAVLRGSDGLVRVELALRGGAGATRDSVRVATDLVVVLDRSGSMSGEPIATALAALRELCAGLADGDRFALVSYASDARIDVALEAASGAARDRWELRIAEIAANGGTAMSSGLDLGHAVLAEAEHAGRVGRLIVLSDGHANEGDYSLEGLRARAGRARARQYVLSSVGIGDGFDETVMSALADAGGGNFHYLPDATRLAGVFANEFAAARETVARGLAVRIAPGAGVSVATAGGYPLEAADGRITFRPGDLFAGQERRIWLTLHAPTAQLGDVALGGVEVEFAATDGERQRVALAALPALHCVADDAAFTASFDAERYQRADRTDAIGALKQSVARKVAAGRQAEAVSEVDEFRKRNELKQLETLGYFDGSASRALDALSNQVAAPAAASPEGASRLGKELLESGRDDQRAGAKK
jgi:Ca-activated chloride channel homolog